MLGLVAPASANIIEKKNILYINSYHIGFYWVEDILKGVQDGFANEKNISLWVEHMDSKRITDRTYFDILQKIYTHKYSDKQIDLLLLSDNNALTFYQ